MCPEIQSDVPIRDIRHDLATNHRCPPPLKDGWYQRTTEQITGITIHHTISHSPWGTAHYYTQKGGGRPSIPYHYWICACGTIFHCLDLTQGCWHDHTGHKNLNISIGMAGTLHITKPTGVQMTNTAALIAYLMRHLNIPIEAVKGHNDYFATTCPGWDNRRHGTWRARMFARIEAHLEILTHIAPER